MEMIGNLPLEDARIKNLISILTSAEPLSLQQKLERAQITAEDYYSLCARPDFIDESMRHAVHQHVFPNIGRLFASTMSDTVSMENPGKARDQMIDLISKFGTLLRKAPSKVEQHLHLENYSDKQLLTEIEELTSRVQEIRNSIPKDEVKKIREEVIRQKSLAPRGKGRPRKSLVEYERRLQESQVARSREGSLNPPKPDSGSGTPTPGREGGEIPPTQETGGVPL